ncbi:MAG TPA: HesA/MoeB/ThiF family protein [Methanotrichaceae archaeon]|nr:HesA/MoeB/ThiF family protein [Methanotrichaceae archaeon]
MLKRTELERYSRQIRLFGEAGQERLKSARAFIAGAGGLGSAVSIYMAAAGFGKIMIVDCDTVEPSNLNRQILHWSADVGRYKAESARETLVGINPEIEVESLTETITDENIDRLMEGCDLVMDAMDNFSTRYVLNRAAFRRRVPLFHGAISGFNGQATTVVPGRTACLQCLFPSAPPVRPFPAVGATCAVIGGIQASEAVKYVLGQGELLENRLLLWDGLRACMDEVAFERSPGCGCCGGGMAHI